MPVYTCTTTQGLLRPDQKTDIAREITRIHCELTGAPADFVHVLFQEMAPGDAFVGGEPMTRSIVRGLVRAGRPLELKARMLADLSAAWGKVSGQAPHDIFVALEDVPASHVIEAGRILPEPGEEEAWLAAQGLAGTRSGL